MAKRKAKPVERVRRPLGGAVFRVKRGGGYLAGWFGKLRALRNGKRKWTQRQLTKDDDDRDGAEVEFAKWALAESRTHAAGDELRAFASWSLEQAKTSGRAAEFEALATAALDAAKEQTPDARTGLLVRSLSSVIDEFLKQRQNEVSSYHVGTLRKQLDRFLGREKGVLVPGRGVGDVPIASVTRATVESFLATLGEQDGLTRTVEGEVGKDGKPKTVTARLTPNTQRHYLSAIGALFAFALDRRYVTVNPARGVKLKRVQQYEAAIVTAEGLAKLYAHTTPPLHDIVVFLGESGARRSEALSLAWHQVAADFSAVTFTATKNRRNRRVPLTSRASAMLKARHEKRVQPLRGEDPVFDPISKEWFNKRFRDARREAGLPQGVTPHSLRHSYCVALTLAGVPFSVSAKILGHSSPAFTATRYGRWVPDGEEARAVAMLDRARGGVPAAAAKTG